MNHRAEKKTTYQTVPQMIAEELEVDLNHVIIDLMVTKMNVVAELPGGNSFVGSAYKHLLRMGASAPEMLRFQAAAKKQNVNSATCYAEKGNVIHRPSNKKFHYGESLERSIRAGNA